MTRPALPRLAVATLLLTFSFAVPAEPGAGHHAQPPQADQRQVLPLDRVEKNFLLAEMREFLAVTQRILAASLAGDMRAVAESAASVGLKAHKDDFANPDSVVQGIRKKAPKEFFPLGRATHAGFDEIADVATRIGDRDAVHRLLADKLQHCVACHAAYRIEEKP